MMGFSRRVTGRQRGEHRWFISANARGRPKPPARFDSGAGRGGLRRSPRRVREPPLYCPGARAGSFTLVAGSWLGLASESGRSNITSEIEKSQGRMSGMIWISLTVA